MTTDLSDAVERMEARLSFQRTLVAQYRIEVFALSRSVNGWKALALKRGLEIVALRRQLAAFEQTAQEDEL